MTRDRVSLAGTLLLAMLLLAILCAPWLARHDPTDIDIPNRLAPPSLDHPFGTDMLGRDMAARILHGGRTSVTLALAAALGISLLGLTIGVVAGVVGGVTDLVLSRVIEVVEVLPLLLLAMFAIRTLGPGPDKLVAVFVLAGWPNYARVVRASTLAIRECPFIESATAQGAGRGRVIARHIVPNLLGPVTVLTTLGLGRILLGLTALSFLGFGVQPPHPEWGRMMADAREYFYAAPRMLIYPGLAISVLVLAVNLCGDGLRDALDRKAVNP